MITFEMKIQNAGELARAFRNSPRISEPILQRAIRASQAVFAKNTLKDDPVPYRTGRLLTSFIYKEERLQARWFPTARYAAHVELGTRPHLITPKRARVLAWQRGGGGRYVTAASGRRYYKRQQGTTVFAAYVRHPGTKPHPFMQRIVDKSQPEIHSLFARASELIADEIARSAP